MLEMLAFDDGACDCRLVVSDATMSQDHWGRVCTWLAGSAFRRIAVGFTTVNCSSTP